MAKGEMEFTGERYIPTLTGNIALEHLHRYLLGKNICRSKSVLDLACGEGYGSAILAEVASAVVGVDISADVVQHAKIKYMRPNLQFMVSSCIEIPLEDHSVDVVISFETLEHHDQHEEMMTQIKRVLRPSGVLLISTPDKYRYSDLPSFKNQFHVKELYVHEFEELLGKRFKNCVFYGQRIVFGSAIFSARTQSKIRTFRSEGTVFSSAEGLVDPLYWLGLASDAELPEFPCGLLEQPIYDSEILRQHGVRIAELVQSVSDRETRIVELTQSILEQSGEISTLKETLAARDTEVNRIKTSYSWRMTEPFRAAARLVRGVGV
jgi:SAM-dependent methyltransferase